MHCPELVARWIPDLHCYVADASPARSVLEAWAEDPDGGELGALLQRYGAGPPSRALLTSLGSQADSAAQDLVIEVLAGAQAPVSSCINNMLWWFAHQLRGPARSCKVLRRIRIFTSQPGADSYNRCERLSRSYCKHGFEVRAN